MTVGLSGDTERYGIVLGRKHCIDCKRWRHACDFHSRTRNGDGTSTRLQSRCKTCEVRHIRIKRGVKKPKRGYRASNRVVNAERWQRIKNDPAQLENHRERNRFSYEKVHGRTRVFKTKRSVERPDGLAVKGKEVLPVEPLRDAFVQWSRAFDGDALAELSRRTGIQPRVLWRVLRDPTTERCALDSADRITHAMNYTLSLVYTSED